MPIVQTTARILLFAVSTTWGVCAERPNIVLILADDLGYNDIGVFGCPDVPTPHIDAIADNGVKFTDGCAHCQPHDVLVAEQSASS